MKNSRMGVRMLLLLLLLVFLVPGCETTNTKIGTTVDDSARLRTVTVRNHFNGKVVTGVVFDVQKKIDPDTGANNGQWHRTAHLLESDTIWDRLLLAIVAGTGAAATQGFFFREAFKMKACRGGANCGSINMNAPLAQSLSESISGASTDVGVSAGSFLAE